MKKPSITICGAGIAGVACAYYLSRRLGDHDILLIDKLAPLSFTTSKSGENFRQYWPQPCMNQFVSHSIELMQALLRDHPGGFDMFYSGYDFVSHKKGSGLFSADTKLQRDVYTVLNDQNLILSRKPYLDKSVEQVIHIHNGGAMDVYAMGSLMFKLARDNGVKFLKSEITDIKRSAGRYQLQLAQQQSIDTQQLVICAGPFTPILTRYLDIELPVYSVAQRKFVIRDTAKVIPRDMPFTIYTDSQHLDWSSEELDLIASDEQFAYLLQSYPPGLHIKPEGQNQIKLGWAFNTVPEDPQWDVGFDPGFTDIVIRGASRFIPGLKQYINNIPTPIVTFAGYYTRTRENLPVIGRLNENLYTVSALAGYGTMAACAAGKLLTDHVLQSDLPGYAKYFEPQRWNNQTLMSEISAIQGDGQL